MITVDVLVTEDVPLAPLTTLRIGGPARYFARAGSRRAVVQVVEWARRRELPLLVLGGGSNLLVADEGFPGVVLRVDVRGVRSKAVDGTVEVTVGAGEYWSALVARAVDQGWAGLECLAGIPGRVGSTPIQNVGAYGQEVAETIASVEALDLQTGEIVRFSTADCGFGYRDSRFKTADRGRFIILSVTYRLTPGGAPHIRYGELERYLSARDIRHPALADVRRAVLEVRRAKSMLVNLRDPDARSAGSFFVNPHITREEFAALEARTPGERADERVPGFPDGDGHVKVSAGWLIEHAGFSRGYVHGNAGLSSKHTLAIINRGGASAHEVVALARAIRDQVRDRFGITLLPEPTMVGVSLE